MEELYTAMIALYSRVGREAKAQELQAELDVKLQEEQDDDDDDTAEKPVAQKASTKAQSASASSTPTRNSFAAAEPEPV